jgi:hypothetical protein
MDAICGVNMPVLRNFYFAYGSNLLEREMLRTASGAQPVGPAYLPGYRLEFAKHSVTRNGDAANIAKDASRMVWGFVYQMDDADKLHLADREKGYSEIQLTVFLVDNEDETQQRVFSFVAIEPCPKQCGPSADYFGLVTEGTEARGFPVEYLQDLKRRYALK